MEELLKAINAQNKSIDAITKALNIATNLVISNQNDWRIFRDDVVNNHPCKGWSFLQRLKWLFFGG